MDNDDKLIESMFDELVERHVKLVEGKHVVVTDEETIAQMDLNNPSPELHDVMNFFEHMGYLLDGKYLNLEDVSVEFHYWILHVWSDAKKLIKSEQAGNKIYYEFFEKMVTRLLNYDRPRTGTLELPSEAEIADFYAEESHLPSGSPIPRQRRLKRRTS
jgi:hypothetical protein